MSFITNPNNAGYVYVSEPWRLGEYPKQQTEEERQKFRRLRGQQLQVSDKTFQMLNSIEPYKMIPYKGMSFDNAMSKICKYYIDSNNSKDIEQIRQVNKEKVDKMTSTIPKQSSNDYDFRREYRNNTIHVEIDTYSLLEQISSNYFSTNPEIRHMTGYFGHNEDTILKIILEYYLDNTTDRKQSTTTTN